MAAKNTNIDLYELLPATYRIDDATQGLALKALMALMSEQANLLKDDISGLYDDLFIETCADWVIPYIGDLVGNNPIYEAVHGRRADVAKTIYYRRRKGTLPMLEELARDITGWNAHAVAFFEMLGWTQNLNHIRYAGAPNAAALDPNAADRVGTVNLRNLNALDLLDGPFDVITHTVDVRKIRRAQGWYNIKKIGFFLWRLQSYRMELSDPKQSAQTYGWHFSPLGNPVPLFNQPVPELSETGLSTEIHVGAPIRPMAFMNDIAATRGQAPQPAASQYFGNGRSVSIFLNSPDAVQPLRATCFDLSAWERPPAAFAGKFSGPLPAINISAAAPEVNVTIGDEGTHVAAPLPAGTPAIAVVASALEAAIRSAASTRGFTGTRVIPVGNQLLVMPGIRGAAISFSGTGADPTTVTDLSLNPLSAASGVMSGDLSDFPKTFVAAPELEVTIGANPPQTITLAAAPTSIADAALKIAAELNAIAFPEFAGAQILVAGSHLLILPGVPGALVRVRAPLADATTAELLKLTNKIAVDVRLGRFAFPIGDEPAAGQVQVSYNYGFSANLGGGPYDRRDQPARLGQAARERPDTVRFPEALGKLIRVPGDALTISAAVTLWNPLTDPHAVIEVDENHTYTENVAIVIPAGELVLQARNQARPTLIGNIDVAAAGGNGRFQLNGFLVAGKLAVHGSLGELKLIHSTLVPGLGLDESGAPLFPDSPSLEIDPANDHLQVIIGHSITGPLQIPHQVVSLAVSDSMIDTSRSEGRAIPLPALISGMYAPFFLPVAAPSLRVTIGDEGPLTVTLSAPPVSETDAAVKFEAAIRAASTSPSFANAKVLVRNSQFYILSGNGGRISVQDAPLDDTATRWKLISPDVSESFGLLSGPLTTPIAVTGAAPSVELIMGTIGPKPVDLTGIPAALAPAEGFLQAAIRAASGEVEFTAAEVFLQGNQFLILPGGKGAAASFVFSAADPAPLLELQLESARPSIAGSVGGEVEAPNTTLDNVTVFGTSYFRELTLASGVIFQQIARSARRQAGCVRFSYITPGSRMPRRYRCQPDMALEGILDNTAKQIIRNRLRPSYTSIHYGDPGYAQLGLLCACEIKTGAENGSEMGAFNLLLQPQREANLRVRLEEYLPFGLEPGLIYIT